LDNEVHAFSGADAQHVWFYTTCGLHQLFRKTSTIKVLLSMNVKSNVGEPEFAAFIGLDWGDARHAVALAGADGRLLQQLTLVHSAEGVREWLQELEKRFGGRPVALGIETSKGPLIHIFSAVPWLVVYPIHPATSARLRRAFTPSGAKDDQPDALVLLDLVVTHRHKLRPLWLDDEATRLLGRMCELRRKTVDRRTQLTNAMRTALKEYFPQVLQLLGEVLYTALALDFLERWPDLLSLKTARQATIKRFYYLHNVRRPEAVQQRLELIQKAVALTTDDAVVKVGVRQVQRLIQELRVLQKHIAEDDRQIAALFKEHPDAPLFRELPGAGAVLAPRLLAGFGTDRTRYQSATEFQRYSGVAPVKEKSGGRVWIHWRWNAPRFLRQSLIEWAGQSILYCQWARTYHQQQKNRGKRHWMILRALAFKWVRILWKCWTTRQPYDEARYLRAFIKQKSPLMAHAT
jgi:transposase